MNKFNAWGTKSDISGESPADMSHRFVAQAARQAYGLELVISHANNGTKFFAPHA